MSNQEYKIAQLLRVAKEDLAFYDYISNYPAMMGKRNFDTASPIDNFYKSVCNAFFNDALLIISSLLDNKDKRVIGFWNWDDFVNSKKAELTTVTNEFLSSQLKLVRDQIVAHQDIANHNNNFPSSRRRGIVESELIKLAQEILGKIINEFFDYTKNYSSLYSQQYFDTGDAKKEVNMVMDLAKPKLTDNFVI